MAVKPEGAETFLPESRSVARLAKAAQSCRGCALHAEATQVVFGAGPRDAEVVLIGEQPGDREDRAGQPFVGPAGRLLDKALAEAGIDRDRVYLTNAVKHFKFQRAERGKQRIHKKPSRTEILACRPWLLAELEALRPGLVVFLGATAAQSLLGTGFKITKDRGRPDSLPAEVFPHAVRFVATVHPSSVLRAPDRDQAYDDFLADLRVAAKASR